MRKLTTRRKEVSHILTTYNWSKYLPQSDVVAPLFTHICSIVCHHPVWWPHCLQKSILSSASTPCGGPTVHTELLCHHSVWWPHCPHRSAQSYASTPCGGPTVHIDLIDRKPSYTQCGRSTIYCAWSSYVFRLCVLCFKGQALEHWFPPFRSCEFVRTLASKTLNPWWW